MEECLQGENVLSGSLIIFKSCLVGYDDVVELVVSI